LTKQLFTANCNEAICNFFIGQVSVPYSNTGKLCVWMIT